MADLYSELKKKSGQNCFTLTHNNPAKMVVDDWHVTIIYPSGNSLEIPRSLITEAIHQLKSKGILTVEDVHENITNQRGPVTDRLMAVLREISGISFTNSPRALYFQEDLKE